MAVIKHIANKNSDYGESERYLIFQHNEYTQKPILDEEGHQGIQHQGIIKLILERDNGTAIKDQSLTFPAVRYIRKLVWGNVELFCKDLSVTGCLVEHQDKVRVFKDVLNLPAG